MLKEIVIGGSINTDSIANLIKISSYLYEKQKYESPIVLDITFIEHIENEDVKIRYKCSISNNIIPTELPKLLEEQLYINDVYIFKKNETDIEFNLENKIQKYYYLNKESDFKSIKQALETQSKLYKINNNNSIFTTWYNNYNPKLVKSILEWFKEKYIILDNFIDNTVPSYTIKRENNNNSNNSNNNSNIEDNILRNKVMHEIKNIIDYGSQEIVLKGNNEDNKNLELNSIYSIKDENNIENAKIIIPSIVTESSGTLKMYKFYGILIKTLLNGGTLFVDELDSSFHPEIVRGIISCFKNKELNNKNAQIIFNTHNPIYLNSNIFRRDEIYFIEKDNQNYKSNLYSLVDFSTIRSDKDYMRAYLNGDFGAIPSCNLQDVILKVIKGRDLIE